MVWSIGLASPVPRKVSDDSMEQSVRRPAVMSPSVCPCLCVFWGPLTKSMTTKSIRMWSPCQKVLKRLPSPVLIGAACVKPNRGSRVCQRRFYGDIIVGPPLFGALPPFFFFCAAVQVWWDDPVLVGLDVVALWNTFKLVALCWIFGNSNLSPQNTQNVQMNLF